KEGCAAAWSKRRNVCVLVFATAWIFAARNYVPREVKGEIDLIGYDGETLAFVEVRTRTARVDRAALPEVSVTAEKQHLVGRTARRFLMERHVEECQVRFEVVAIESYRVERRWYGCTRTFLTRGCKKPRWKIRRNRQNAVI